MHMADALLSPAVGGLMLAVSAGAVGFSAAKIRREELDDKKIPMMGVMGAFVFAAQMINFTIPGTGSSGHIGGGILLAALLGPFPALLTITAVLLIQCLFFADGGLLALGCNIFNMGVTACLIGYPLLFRPIVKKGFRPGRIIPASILAVVVSLQLGAFSVVLETLVSGVTELPFTSFVVLMQPIHLAIGLVEGAITAAVLCFIQSARPEILESAADRTKLGAGVPMKKVLGVLLVLTVLVGGALSLFASSYPDGLEWSIQKVTGSAELSREDPVQRAAGQAQEATALMPDYNFKSAGDSAPAAGTSTAGIVGGALTLVLVGAAGVILSAVKKRRAS